MNTMKSLTTIVALALLAGTFGCSATSSGGQKGKDGSASGFTDEDLALAEQNRYGEGNIPQAQEDGMFKDIMFDYDSAAIRPEYHEMLRQNASVLQADTTLNAEIEGHCDKRGTNEYNLALGEERAKAVAALMVSFGASPSQVSTISYGEEIPVDPAENEQAYSKNRRAHFALYRGDKKSGQ
jgi:peptidoglycan-associated lipoprotein